MRAVNGLVVVALSIAMVGSACTETPGATYYDVVAASGTGGTAGASGGFGGAPQAEPSHRGGGGAGLTAGASGTPASQGGGGAGADGTSEPGGMGGAPAGAGTGSSAPPRPTICARVLSVESKIEEVRRLYFKAVYDDCRVRGTLVAVTDADELKPYSEQLALYGAWLWGCAGAQKDVAFGIAYKPSGFTQGDVDVLVDHYVASANAALSLTAEERERMRRDLQDDAAGVIADPSPSAFSSSTCPGDGDGGGGQGGGGQGDAGGGSGGFGGFAGEAGQNAGGTLG